MGLDRTCLGCVPASDSGSSLIISPIPSRAISAISIFFFSSSHDQMERSRRAKEQKKKRDRGASTGDAEGWKKTILQVELLVVLVVVGNSRPCRS